MDACRHTCAQGIPGWAALGTRMPTHAHSHMPLHTCVCPHPLVNRHAHPYTCKHVQAYAQCAANQEVGQDIILPDMTHSHSHSALKCQKGLEEMRDFCFITIPTATFIDTQLYA